TTDVAFTATFLLAMLGLLRWIEQPTWGRALLGGLALGLPAPAHVSPRPLRLSARPRFSAVVLPLLAVVAAVARRSLGPRPGTARRMVVHAPAMALAAFVVVWGA